MHEGHIGRWQHLVMCIAVDASFVVLGGRELEQAKQRVVVRSMALPTPDEDEECRYGYMLGTLSFFSNPSNCHIPNQFRSLSATNYHPCPH